MCCISYRLRSEKEIRQRLAEKEFAPDVIDRVVENLHSANILNDRQFAAAFVHDMILRKKIGKTRLLRELRSKGVAPEIAQEAVQSTVQDDEEEYRALETAAALLKRYRSSRKKTDALKQRQRLASFLGRKGYDFGTINKVVKKLFKGEAEEE